MAVLTMIALLCCAQIAAGGFVDVSQSLVGRVIHVETLRYRGSWLDAHHTGWMKFTGSPQSLVFGRSWTQFMVKRADRGYVNLESLRYANKYVDAHHSGTLRTTYSNYPQNQIWAQWRIECDNKNLNKCRFYSPRYNNYIDAHHKGYAKLAGYGYWSLVRVFAPSPADYYQTLLSTENQSSLKQTKSISYMEGITDTTSKSKTISSTTSAEIGGAFKAVSASLSSSLSVEWKTTRTKTFQSSTTLEYTISIPPKTKITLQQLIGTYGPFTIGAKKFKILSSPL